MSGARAANSLSFFDRLQNKADEVGQRLSIEIEVQEWRDSISGDIRYRLATDGAKLHRGWKSYDALVFHLDTSIAALDARDVQDLARTEKGQ
jgi:hypothetical protein